MPKTNGTLCEKSGLHVEVGIPHSIDFPSRTRKAKSSRKVCSETVGDAFLQDRDSEVAEIICANICLISMP